MTLAVISAMPKTKPAPPAKRRGRKKTSTEQLDDLDRESNGVVASEMEELDTDRYELPTRRH
jgi:hypothetical protein